MFTHNDINHVYVWVRKNIVGLNWLIYMFYINIEPEHMLTDIKVVTKWILGNNLS